MAGLSLELVLGESDVDKLWHRKVGFCPTCHEEKSVKAKGKSSRGEARGRGRAGSVLGREDEVAAKKVGPQAKRPADDRPAETTGEVRAEAAALARSIAQVASSGNSQARDRGPAPPMPVPIATFNI